MYSRVMYRIFSGRSLVGFAFRVIDLFSFHRVTADNEFLTAITITCIRLNFSPFNPAY